jgi:hypothetical protein
MKIKIEKLYRNDKDKNGNPLMSRTGKPYSKISITADEKMYSGFAGKWNETWKIGDEIDVEIEEAQYNGKTYYNIKAPASAKGGGFGGNTQVMEGLLGSIDTKLSKIVELLQKNKSVELPVFNEGEGLPF